MSLGSLAEESGITVGMVIAEKYRVERLLGTGGMGSVVEARHVALGQKVALKLLHPAALGDSESLARFFREAQATASLDCEQVVKVHDIGQTEYGTPFIVMERLVGADLADCLQRWGPFSVGLAIECVLQAALGMAEAHAASIVHRDLKPSNLFLVRRKNGTPLIKILDFGISKVATRDQVALTQTRNVVGSPLYMSPEQVRDARKVDERSDVWSLGAILHELLSGSPAFDGETLPSVCASIIADEPRPIWRDDVPGDVKAIVLRCLEKNPEKRYPSATSLVEALRVAASEHSFSLLPPLEEDLSSRPAGFPLSTSDVQVKNTHGDLTLADSGALAVPRSKSYELQRTPGAFGPVAPTLATAGSSTPGNGRRFLFVALAIAVALGALGLVLRNAPEPVSPTSPEAISSASLAPLPEKRYSLAIDSTPPGALVMDGDKMLGRTPLVLPGLSIGQEKELVLREDGFVPYVVPYGHLSEDRHVSVELLASASRTEEPAPALAKPERKTAPRPVVKSGPKPATPGDEIRMTR